MTTHNLNSTTREADPLRDFAKNLEPNPVTLRSLATWNGHDLYLQSLDVVRSGSQGFIRREGKIIAIALATISALSLLKASQLTIPITAFLVFTAAHILVREIQFNRSFNRLTSVFNDTMRDGHVTISLDKTLTDQEKTMVNWALFYYAQGLTEEEKNKSETLAEGIFYFLSQTIQISELEDAKRYGLICKVKFYEFCRALGKKECLLFALEKLFSINKKILCLPSGVGFKLNPCFRTGFSLLTSYFINGSFFGECIKELNLPSSFDREGLNLKRRALKNPSQSDIPARVQRAADLLEQLHKQLLKNKVKLSEDSSYYGLDEKFYNSMIAATGKEYGSMFVDYDTFIKAGF